MQLQKIDPSLLPYSQLFKTYLGNFSELVDLFEGDPSNNNQLTVYNGYSGNRSLLKDLLLSFNRPFEPHTSALENINRLASDNALTMVTGQQLGIFGGAMYTIYKILTVIISSREAEARLKVPVIPVFWMADEDHDFEEISKVSVFQNNQIRVLKLSKPASPARPVADVVTGEEVARLIDELEKELQPTEFRTELIKLLRSSYKPESTHAQAFGKLITRLFSHHGLILAGSNNTAIKRASSPVLKRSIIQAAEISQILEKQSTKLGKKFNRQAFVGSSNLFYLTKDKGRQKLEHNRGIWSTSDGIEFSTSSLLVECDKYPERFSPNVFLRPIIQDIFLPNIAYVAGPGEIAYYAQMKTLYKFFEQKMSIIIPRFTGTIIESSIARYMKELPFNFHEYVGRREDIVGQYIRDQQTIDMDQVTISWTDGLNKLADSLLPIIDQIDASLTGTLESVRKEQIQSAAKLHQKMLRSIKQKQEVQIRRIGQICENLFPAHTLQEREVSFVYFMNKYGMDIWDRLLTELDGDLQKHHLIYL